MLARELIAIAVFGAAGALGRYGVSRWALKRFGDSFPYGTLLVNVAGCLLIGFMMELGLSSEALPKWLKTALTVGFLGALTTFSTFGYESIQLIRNGSIGPAVLSVGGNLVLGVLAVVGGIFICRGILN